MIILLLIFASLTSPSDQYYQITGLDAALPGHQDYTEAVGSPLLNAALFKRVTASPNVLCGSTSSFFFPLGAFLSNTPLTSESTGTKSIIQRCYEACVPRNLLTINDSTPSDSQNNLLTGENVFKADLSVATYVLTITVSSISEGESVLFNMTFLGYAHNVLLKVNVSQGGQSCDLSVVIPESSIGSAGPANHSADVDSVNAFVELDVHGANQLAFMSESGQGVAFLLNGTVIYSTASAALASLTLSPPTDSFRYDVIDWKIFNETLTSEQLFTMKNDSQLAVSPASQCGCNQDFPIFQRWPSSSADDWMGVYCQSVDGNKTMRRFNEESHIAQLITDGDFSTYWMSAKDISQIKLTVDLGAFYQIFYATLTLLSLPKYLVVTKTRGEESAQEETLFVISPNCSVPLPSHLPQGVPLRCKDVISLFNSELKDDARLAYLDWTEDILYPNFITKDQAAFEASLRDGDFEAQTVSIYLYDYQISVVPRFSINELAVYGSGLCKNGGQTERVEGGDRSNLRIYTSPNFEQSSGYRCLCANMYEGDHCTQCASSSYEKSGSCISCNCGVGAIADSCIEGRCECNPEGAGSEPQLADEKCHPYVHFISPTYGPLDGGTLLLVEGAWLSSVQYVNLGPHKCYKLLNQTNSETNFYCSTPQVGEISDGVTPVYIDESAALANFSYLPNPNITAIGRIEVFIKGGLDIPVKGTNLQSVSDPKITVTVTCRISEEVIDTLQEDCLVVSAEEMNCQSPDFSGILENENTRCSESTRRKRETDAYAKYDFIVGFILDGVKEFKKASDSPWLEESSSLYIRPDPYIREFIESDRIRKLEKGETSMEILGRDLSSGTMPEDYTINIGIGGCDSTSVFDNKLVCILPTTIPEPGVDSRPHPDDSDVRIPAVTVSVGNIKTHVGYLAPHLKTKSILLPALLGTFAGVLVIIVVVVVYVFRKRESNIQTKRQLLPSSSRYVSGPHSKVGANYLCSQSMTLLEKWVIPHEKLELGGGLGQGQFGKVFLGTLETDKGTIERVAVKTIKGDLLRDDEKAVDSFLQEAISMTGFDHPNVLCLIGVVINEDQMPMVLTPLMSKSDLKHVLLDEKEEFTVGDLIHMGLQAADGMAYLASKKFVHRDLAARNCMVNDEYIVKIADFGLSHDIYGEDYYRVQDQTKPLPVKWMSIESLLSGKYTVQSDVWSYGVLLWELMTRGGTPYPGVNNYEIKGYLNMGRRLPCPEVCPEEMYKVMCACWNVNPADRPTFFQICNDLQAFLNDNSDYHRESTRCLENKLYYCLPEGEVNPAYVNDFESRLEVSDYDIAVPVMMAPTSPAEDKNVNDLGFGAKVGDYDVAAPVMLTPTSPEEGKYEIGPEFSKNNNNNKAESGASPSDENSTSADGYLAPVQSRKVVRVAGEPEPLKTECAGSEGKLSISWSSQRLSLIFQKAKDKLGTVATDQEEPQLVSFVPVA